MFDEGRITCIFQKVSKKKYRPSIFSNRQRFYIKIKITLTLKYERRNIRIAQFYEKT